MKDKIKVAVIGVGGRGHGMIGTIDCMDDVEIIGVCDVYQDRVEAAQKRVFEEKGWTPFGTTDYNEIFELEGLDSVYIASDWSTHIKIAIAAMKKGIPAAMEVGGAYSLDECWELVDTYEKTGTWAMMMENCCYGEREMMVHNMVRQGLFGKIVFCAGQYAHDLRGEVGFGTKNRHYRLRNYLSRNCENYPTHELGPIAKILEINRGNRMTSMVSYCTGSYGMKDYVNKTPELQEELSGRDFAQADIVKTIIKTERGEMIELTLDTTLPRYYSRGFTVRGTDALYQEDGDTLFCDNDSELRKFEWNQGGLWGNAAKFAEEYNSDLWKKKNEDVLNAGHGGMDWYVLRAWVETVKTDALPPIDVYDAASWMCITPLSEISLKNGGQVMEIPDFTRGKYKDREPLADNAYAIK